MLKTIPTAILVNGSINAGKTTVSRALCLELPRTAHVEVDALRDFVDWMPLEESIALNLSNAAAVAKNFLEHGLNVVVSYPLNREDYLYLKERLEPFPLFCFTLSPRLEVAQRDRGSRELTEQERERVAFHYGSGIASPNFGVALDNSDLTPEETARAILDRIAHARGV
jgi:Chloramphenicol phosphotransferase-like protein.